MQEYNRFVSYIVDVASELTSATVPFAANTLFSVDCWIYNIGFISKISWFKK